MQQRPSGVCLDMDNAAIILFMVFTLHDGMFSRTIANNNSVIGGLPVKRIPFQSSHRQTSWLIGSSSFCGIRVLEKKGDSICGRLEGRQPLLLFCSKGRRSLHEAPALSPSWSSSYSLLWRLGLT